PPQFLDEESSPSHVSVQEGHNVRLVCRAKGVPKPTLSWTRQHGTPINSGLGAKVHQVDSEELMLKGVTRKDMGPYYCIARNKVPPSISKRIVLDVHLHFWRFSGQLLINSSRQETQEIHDGYTTNMSLSLKAIKPRDFGIYVCSAKNSLGETESNVRLYKINVSRETEKANESNKKNEGEVYSHEK
ncbi:hypothetical protein Pcinc_017326, partial [Petrolisthes cinctipes]